MSFSELRTWVAYDLVEGVPNPWLQTGILASVVHNPWAKSPLPPEHFMPVRRRDEPENPADPEGIANLFAICPAMREHYSKPKG